MLLLCPSGSRSTPCPCHPSPDGERPPAVRRTRRSAWPPAQLPTSSEGPQRGDTLLPRVWTFPWKPNEIPPATQTALCAPKTRDSSRGAAGCGCRGSLRSTESPVPPGPRRFAAALHGRLHTQMLFWSQSLFLSDEAHEGEMKCGFVYEMLTLPQVSSRSKQVRGNI